MEETKKIPTGVKIISVLLYIAAVLGVIVGLFIIFGTGIITLFLPMLAGWGVLIGILIIGLSIFNFFVARSLWKAKNWARIITIIFAGVGIIFAIIQMVQGDFISSVINLAINGLIGGYLIFSKKVKKIFA